jgi:NAD-reducing hydrogenase small subunit
MSLLDIDERILTLVELVDFDRSPINDIKQISGPVDIGLVEGGCANEENVRVLQEFREHCKVLISVSGRHDSGRRGDPPASRSCLSLS